jgi:hypothetical protein
MPGPAAWLCPTRCSTDGPHPLPHPWPDVYVWPLARPAARPSLLLDQAPLLHPPRYARHVRIRARATRPPCNDLYGGYARERRGHSTLIGSALCPHKSAPICQPAYAALSHKSTGTVRSASPLSSVLPVQQVTNKAGRARSASPRALCHTAPRRASVSHQVMPCPRPLYYVPMRHCCSSMCHKAPRRASVSLDSPPVPSLSLD